MKKLLILTTILSIIFGNISIINFAEEFDARIPVLKLVDEFGMIEAEDCYRTTGYRTVKVEGASGGVVLNPWGSRSEDAEAGALRYAENGIDDLSLYIEVETEGYYTIWMRVYSTTGSHGNFISHINGAFTLRQLSITDLFTWGAAETVKLKKGKNLFGVMPRYGMDIDKILVTSSEYYAPIGMGEKPGEFMLGKEGETMKGMYYPLPAYTPPSQHPRLYLNPGNIEIVKQNLTLEQNLPAWESVKKLADSNVNCTMDSNATYSFSSNVHRYLEACAFVYAIDNVNNEEYGHKAVDGLIEYLSTVSYSASGSLELARSGIVQYIAKVYDWCYNLLDDEKKSFLMKKSLAMAAKLECGWPAIQENAFTSGHGHESSIQVDMMSLAVATYEDYPDIWNVTAGRYFSEFIPINRFWHKQSIFQGDGDAYGKSRFGYETKGNLILYSLGLENLVPEEERLMAYNQIYRRRPDGVFMKDGDTYDKSLVSGAYYVGEMGPLFSTSVRYNDPYLKYEMYKMKKNGIEDAGESEGNTIVEFLIYNDPSLDPESYDSLPLTMYGGEGHNMLTARTGWDEGMDSNTMIVSMKGGGRYRGDHQHLDAGTFTIYYKGLLALDAGEYQGLPFYDENGKYVTNTHFGSDHQKDYMQRTIAHNCILVYDPDEVMPGSRPGGTNDGGQVKARNIGENDSKTYEEATSDDRIHATRIGVDYGPDMNEPAYSYIKTDITNAYCEKMKNYERTMLFFNFFDDVYPGALIVLDKVESSNPEFKKTWLLHSQEEPEIIGNSQIIKRTEFGYNGRLINNTLLPQAEDLNVEKIGGEGKEYWVDGKNATAVTVIKGDESGKWRIEVSPKTKKDKDYFLNVIQVSDNNDTINPLLVKQYENESHYGVQIKDRVAYLSKEEEQTYNDVKVHIEGEGKEEYKWVVDGLRYGRWKITDNSGNTVAYSDVTKEGGIAYFEAPAGYYTLKRERGFNNIPSKDFNFLNAMGEVNPKEIKLSYNTMYQYLTEENKIEKINGQIYLPFEKMLSIMDSEYKFSVKDNKIDVVFEDNEYTFLLNENKVLKKFQYSDIIDEKEITYKPLFANNKYYIHSSVLTDIFQKSYYFDTVADIVWISNPYERAKDFLLDSNEKNRINIKDATGTDFYYAYKPYMAHDGDIGSMAGTNTLGGTLTYEFKEEEFLDHVSIFWNSGSSRDYNYEFYVSTDGVNYEPAASGNTGFTQGYVDYPIGKRAKYFKMVSNGNTINDWFVIKEMKFYNK